jgi:hypothetical protein
MASLYGAVLHVRVECVDQGSSDSMTMDDDEPSNVGISNPEARFASSGSRIPDEYRGIGT